MTTEQQLASSSTDTNRGFFGLLPEALLIASLTAGAYWLAFVYELAYLGVFDLPPDLVQVSLQTTLLTALALCGAWSVFWPINLGSLLWPEHPAIQRKILPSIICLFLLTWWVFNFGFRTKDWSVYLVLLICAVIGTAVQFLPDTGPEPPTIIDRIAVALGRPAGLAVLGFIAFIIVASILVYIAGRAKAERQKAYFLFSDYPEIAVIRIYSDRILAVPFDRRSKTVRPEVIIRKIDQKDIRLTLDKDVGPLTTPK
jgi:hypothetical protein